MRCAFFRSRLFQSFFCHNSSFLRLLISILIYKAFEERQKHITDYLFEHPDFTGYMILDDLYLPYLNKNLIKCETLEGFNEQKCHQAHMMLRQMEVRRSALKCKKYA